MGTLIMLSAVCDNDASAYGMKLPKSHVASHIDCLDVRNVMLPFSMSLPLQLSDTTTSTNGIR